MTEARKQTLRGQLREELVVEKRYGVQHRLHIKKLKQSTHILAFGHTATRAEQSEAIRDARDVLNYFENQLHTIPLDRESAAQRRDREWLEAEEVRQGMRNATHRKHTFKEKFYYDILWKYLRIDDAPEYDDLIEKVSAWLRLAVDDDLESLAHHMRACYAVWEARPVDRRNMHCTFTIGSWDWLVASMTERFNELKALPSKQRPTYEYEQLRSILHV